MKAINTNIPVIEDPHMMIFFLFSFLFSSLISSKLFPEKGGYEEKLTEL
jgi:hypothetical protein